MRYFLTDVEPTPEQLVETGAEVLSGTALNSDGYVVAFEGEERPEWLSEAHELNVPGEPHRCTHCGETIE